MPVFRHLGAAVPAALCLLLNAVSPAAAAPAPLAAGLKELSAAYDRGDSRLPAQLKLHITSAGGDPLVLVKLQPGANAQSVLANLAALGFRLQTRSSINPSLVEGYLALSATHAAAAVAGVHSLHATEPPS